MSESSRRLFPSRGPLALSRLHVIPAPRHPGENRDPPTSKPRSRGGTEFTHPRWAPGNEDVRLLIRWHGVRRDPEVVESPFPNPDRPAGAHRRDSATPRFAVGNVRRRRSYAAPARAWIASTVCHAASTAPSIHDGSP